jgi:hypothetical protein
MKSSGYLQINYLNFFMIRRCLPDRIEALRLFSRYGRFGFEAPTRAENVGGSRSPSTSIIVFSVSVMFCSCGEFWKKQQPARFVIIPYARIMTRHAQRSKSIENDVCIYY